MTPASVERYARHLILKEIGGPGQRALLAAKVAIVGAGGLGGPVGLYLAAAGVGHITVLDDDIVEASNLQRHVPFVHTDLGMPKAEIMADTLRDLNPDITVTPEKLRVTRGNAERVLSGHDIIIDGVDDFAARHVINKAALTLGTPLVSGALGRFDGQVAGFPSDGVGPCYRCFVPEIPPDAETCAQLGVVGALAGVIGSIMAMEVIKIITGAGTPLLGRLYLYDGLAGEGRTVTLPRDPNCVDCGS